MKLIEKIKCFFSQTYKWRKIGEKLIDYLERHLNE